MNHYFCWFRGTMYFDIPITDVEELKKTFADMFNKAEAKLHISVNSIKDCRKVSKFRVDSDTVYRLEVTLVGTQYAGSKKEALGAWTCRVIEFKNLVTPEEGANLTHTHENRDEFWVERGAEAPKSVEEWEKDPVSSRSLCGRRYYRPNDSSGPGFRVFTEPLDMELYEP